MKHTRIILTAIIALLSSVGFAQSDSTAKQGPRFKFGINYNSNLNYYGRTDSLTSTGVFPLAELWVSPKFYINAAPVFVNNKLQSFDYAGTVATLGYQNITEKWLTNFYLLKPFYKSTSNLVQSALKAQSGLTFGRLTRIVNVSVGGDIKLSDRLDYGASAGLDHVFRIPGKKNDVFVIDPSVYVYAGTQNFSRTYTRKKNDVLLFPGGSEQVTEQVQKFNVLAYEASVPLIYARGKWMVLATPSYILPQNLITVEGRPDLSEKGENLFYVTMGLKYSF